MEKEDKSEDDKHSSKSGKDDVSKNDEPEEDAKSEKSGKASVHDHEEDNKEANEDDEADSKHSKSGEKAEKVEDEKAEDGEDEEIISVHKDNNEDSDSDSIDISTEEQLLMEIESFYLEANSVKEKVGNVRYILEKLQLVAEDIKHGNFTIHIFLQLN